MALGTTDSRNTLTFGGTSQIAGGDIGGGEQLINTGTLTLSGVQLGVTLTNQGTVLQTGDIGVNGSTINNATGAVWDLQNDANIASFGPILVGSSVNNSGTFRKSTGTGTSSIAGAGLVSFSNAAGGTIDVRSGTLYFQAGRSTGGNLQIAPGAVLDLDASVPGGSANGSYAGTYTVSGGGVVRVGPGHVFPVDGQAGATFNFTAGSFEWTGGTIDAGAGLTVNGTLDLTGSVTLDGPLTNGGTIVQTGHLNFANGTVNNSAGHLYDLQTDDTFSVAPNASGTINNAGTFRKSAGTGAATIVRINDDGGTIDVQSGTLTTLGCGSYTGSTFTVAPGAVFDPVATHEASFSGTLTGSGGGTVLLDGGTLDTGSDGATFNFPAGMLQWTSGIIQDPGGLTNAGSVTLTGGALATTLTNTGTIIEPSGGLTFVGGVLDNAAGGLFDMQTDAGFGVPINSSGRIDNAGTFRKSAGTGTATVAVDFNNVGTVEARSGTLLLHDGVEQLSGQTLTAGTWSVFAGSTLTIRVANLTTNAATVNLSGAGASFTSLAGLESNTGSLNLQDGAAFTTAGDLTNSGTLTVGAGSTLAVTGKYTQAGSGGLDVQLGGPPAGGQYGRVNATAAATLDGSLNVSVTDGYTPAAGDTFPVLTFAQVSGDFAPKNGLRPGGNVILQPVYDPAGQPTRLDLVAGPLVTASGASLSAVEGQPFSGPVATFTDADGTATPADFTATIAWGDGSTSAGTVTQPGGPGTPFQVSGSHTYTAAGTFAVGVTLRAEGGPSATASGAAQVAPPPVHDVTAQVSVSRGKVRGKGRRVQQTLTLKNTGGVLGGSVSLVLDGLPRRVKVLGMTGTTQAQGRRGSPYVDVVPAGGTVAPGQAVTVTLTFIVPAGRRLRYTTRVLAGVGPR